ncbi:thioesterase family protein [Petrotoga sp. 9PWA.NaAc.5.4]|uniref:thioesterase family protein n=1 Tax=Petrotoga sp. 9PWA.NaAc.5.4 TaxID=1434328 RepID=UPI000CB17AC3|nr:thioesterase [Petrotoga sp. 9PWA.NaAc.5.4]PNR96750.1 thioesterase [Petrotoga sp. 9PWA.NaAc.5.4]
MNILLERISLLKDKEFNYSFKVKDDSFLWQEDEEVKNFHVLSTTALIGEIHKCCFYTLKDVLDDEHVSVVSHSSIDHLSPTPYSFKVFIKLKITEVVANKVFFKGEAFDELNKIAEFEVTRNIVSKKMLRKYINQQLKGLNVFENSKDL